jgi:NADP-dependent aldehyde dehydrogenase
VAALPGILTARGAELAATLAGSISLGCGQFCTSPGVIVLPKDAASDAFVAQLLIALAAQKPRAMPTPAIDRFLRPVALQDAPAWLLHRRGQAC